MVWLLLTILKGVKEPHHPPFKGDFGKHLLRLFFMMISCHPSKMNIPSDIGEICIGSILMYHTGLERFGLTSQHHYGREMRLRM